MAKARPAGFRGRFDKTFVFQRNPAALRRPVLRLTPFWHDLTRPKCTYLWRSTPEALTSSPTASGPAGTSAVKAYLPSGSSSPEECFFTDNYICTPSFHHNNFQHKICSKDLVAQTPLRTLSELILSKGWVRKYQNIILGIGCRPSATLHFGRNQCRAPRAPRPPRAAPLLSFIIIILSYLYYYCCYYYTLLLYYYCYVILYMILHYIIVRSPVGPAGFPRAAPRRFPPPGRPLQQAVETYTYIYIYIYIYIRLTP